MSECSDLLMKIIDPITNKYLEIGFRSLSDDELVLLSVWMLEAEVNNGGFNQFYWNSAGDVAKEVVGSLRKIGAHKTAEIVLEANSLFGKFGPSSDRDERQNQLEQIEEKYESEFELLDSRFYDYPHDLEALMYEYAKNI